MNCSCNDSQFHCQCYKNNPVDCKVKSFNTFFRKSFTGCIPIKQQNDEIEQCPDGSDENYQFKNIVSCGSCNVTITRLSNKSECNIIPFFSCNYSTCYTVPSFLCSTIDCSVTDCICTSNCSTNSARQCNRTFQCNNGNVGLTNQLCNGKIDCFDKSDEIQYQHGFKCVAIDSDRKCVLPQRNLYDDVAQCKDESDLCKDNLCFECFDRRLLISSKQVCDGVFDCYDWSDECLCEEYFDLNLCNTRFSHCHLLFADNDKKGNFYNISNLDYNKIIFNVNADIAQSTKICQSRLEDRRVAILCDGRPECSDFSDECNCDNPPKYCNDSCHIGYNIGDRYCDGVVDNFYDITNKLNCRKGFDERNCPKRFVCKAGDKISIDVDQVCDGKRDCYYNRDENNCKSNENSVFLSEQDLIASPLLKTSFWIVAIVNIAGNLYVIIAINVFLMTSKFNKSMKYQCAIFLNISIADLVMGIYLVIIAVYSVQYSGYYNQIDFEWRSSLSCSIVGSLAVISNEASCLLTVLLASSFWKIYKPFSSHTESVCLYSLAIIFVWLISFTIAALPYAFPIAEYFLNSVEFSNRFTRSLIWKKEKIKMFACRLGILTNKTMKYDSWDYTKSYLKTDYPEYSPGVQFGYYGLTSVCMPRFYVYQGEQSWEYSLAIITLNFLCFCFIAIIFVCIFKRSTRNKDETRNNQNEEKQIRMQRGFSRIIVSNFLCWIFICIIAFVKVSGYYVDDVAYIVSFVWLLPIKSALNPLLFFSLPNKLQEKLSVVFFVVFVIVFVVGVIVSIVIIFVFIVVV